MGYLTKKQLIDQCTRKLIENDWSDYFLLVGISDVWVPYMIITLLERVENTILQKKRSNIFDKLHSISKGKPVGYNRASPNDCDSSIWYARAMVSFGVIPSEELIAYIISHQDSTGKFSTYTINDNIHTFIMYKQNEVQEWFKPHDCVSINGDSLFIDLNIDRKNKSLRKNTYNNFTPYWWADKRVPILMSNDTMQKEILAQINVHPRYLSPVDIIGKWQEYKYFSKILCYLIESKTNSLTNFPDGLPSNIFSYSKCVMQIPDPKKQELSSWHYSGLMQGARVEDINNIVTSALILSNLTTKYNS